LRITKGYESSLPGSSQFALTTPGSQARPRARAHHRRTRNLVWAAWTKPEHVSKWFTPAPWTVTDCKIERSREGKEFPNIGCDLEIIPNERLVWTDALLAG
jgi:uncharacterized protein YndB with AHSA1/START domain